MAVAKAQYAISEMVNILRSKGINVRVRNFVNILILLRPDISRFSVCHSSRRGKDAGTV